MSFAYRWWLTLLAAAWLAATAGAAWAQGAGPAGRFIFVVGDVYVVGKDGARRPAERGGEFREGETLVTGPNALAQMRTADSGQFSVRADTEMKLDKFAYAGETDRNAAFLASVLKGGFRTITGLIGRAHREGYRVTTPTATVGIRGTHYEVVHVVPEAAPKGVQPGTYNRVYEGITTLQNKAGALILVSRDQTGFAAVPGNVAPVLVVPPGALFGRPTPVPGARSQGSADKAGKDRSAGPGPAQRAVGPGPSSREVGPGPQGRSSLPAVQRDPGPSGSQQAPALLTPLDTPTTTTISPTTTTISPTTTTISPTTSTISPTTSTLSTTTTISPTTTTLSPTTSTLSTTTTTSPTTTTISPTTTTISPTTTTITK